MSGFTLPHIFRRRIILFAAIFLIGGITGWYLGHWQNSAANRYVNSIRPLRDQNSKYKFTNPLLGYDSAESTTEFTEYKPLENKITQLIQQKTTAQEADHVSVYFRDLDLGRWVGINENDAYDPASLLKVPLMITYLKQAESDPQTLNRSLTFTKEMDSSSQVPFETPTQLKVGSHYTTEQLLEAMIGDSDNGAKDVLLSQADQNSLKETYSDLGITNPTDIQGNYLISPKLYALFFRVLYNATYLNRTMSEKALELLSETNFNDGLAAGLPQGVKVAQKYGEHVNADANGQPTEIELHNCGIVYEQTTPYILCVMTKGKDLSKLERAIADISKLIYKEVNNRYK